VLREHPGKRVSGAGFPPERVGLHEEETAGHTREIGNPAAEGRAAGHRIGSWGASGILMHVIAWAVEREDSEDLAGRIG
jgi:hypothetical protein